MDKYRIICKCNWLFDKINSQIEKINLEINSINKHAKEVPEYLIISNTKIYNTGKRMFDEGNKIYDKMKAQNEYSNTYINVINKKFLYKAFSCFNDLYLSFHEYRKYISRELMLNNLISEFRILIIHMKDLMETLYMLYK